jgi:hypothetical protein
MLQSSNCGGGGSLEAVDLGKTPTQNIKDLLSCQCSLFFASNSNSPFLSWQATGTLNCHGHPCTLGKRDNNNDCATTPNDDNQLDKDGGEDVVCMQGEATVHQEAVVGASRGRGGATGGDVTTSWGKQEGGTTRCDTTTRRPIKMLQHDKKPQDNKPGK